MRQANKRSRHDVNTLYSVETDWNHTVALMPITLFPLLLPRMDAATTRRTMQRQAWPAWSSRVLEVCSLLGLRMSRRLAVSLTLYLITSFNRLYQDAMSYQHSQKTCTIRRVIYNVLRGRAA